MLFLQDRIGTANAIVVDSIRTGEPKGYEHASALKPKSDAEIRCEKLSAELAQAHAENESLRSRVAELEAKLSVLEGGGTPKAKPRQAITDAIMTDKIVNGDR